jgi:hypothetical protein
MWCPTNPASYDVTRSISPLTKKKPSVHSSAQIRMQALSFAGRS